MNSNVQAKLDSLKYIYDDVHAKQTELSAIREARDAGRARDQALAADMKQVEDAQARLRNLESAIRTEINRRKQVIAPPVPVDVIVKPTIVRSRNPAPTARSEADRGAAPLPQPPAQEDRVQLKGMIGRFVRYRLDQLNPDILPEFNRLLNQSDCPVGQALAMLDWSIAYAQPLHDRETDDEWVVRLDRWGILLQEYLEGLFSDLEIQSREFNDMLPLLEYWRKRATDPQVWERIITDSRLALQELSTQLDRDADDAQKRLAELTAGSLPL